MRKSARAKGVVILVLLVFSLAIWYGVYREDRQGMLTVSFLAVGEGTAVFIDAPSGRQVLIDGGPNGEVLRQLGSVMPPWDRSIDVIVATSPDPGSVSGLVDVLPRYAVRTVVQSGIENTSAMWNVFEKEVESAAANGTTVLTGTRGQVIDMGKGARLEIIFPDRPLPGVASADGCIIARLVYGTTAFLLPCNASANVGKYIAMLDGTGLKSDVLLASKNTPTVLIGYASPQYIVRSGGCDTEGAETETFDAEVVTTCNGSVTFVSDGKSVRVR